MPRRIPDYSIQFADFNMISSIGAFIYGLAQLIFLFNIIRTIYFGEKTTKEQTWESARGLEWTLPSPLPFHTFERPPSIK
jgi:cytochrome c oxidase subunit 1